MNQLSLTVFLLAIGGCAVDEPAMKPDAPGPAAARATAGSTVLLAGTRSLVVSTTPDASHCGGAAVAVRQVATPDDVEPELVAAMTIEFPAGLDFTADPAAARARFEAFLSDAVAKSERAVELYQQRVADPSTSAQVRAAAVAREVQITRRLGEVLVHAELPRDATTGDKATDKANAFCANLATAAEPLLRKADVAAARCRELAVPDGWWTAACAAR